MLQSPEEQELYDLLLLGLSWMRQDMPSQLDRTCASIVRALCNAGALPGRTNRTLKTNAKLVGLIMGRMVDIRESRGRRKRLTDLIETAEHHLVALVPSSEPFLSVGLVGPRGYGIAITARGMAYAEQVSPNYVKYVTHTKFREGWALNRRKMGAMSVSARRLLTDPVS